MCRFYEYQKVNYIIFRDVIYSFRAEKRGDFDNRIKQTKQGGETMEYILLYNYIFLLFAIAFESWASVFLIISNVALIAYLIHRENRREQREYAKKRRCE